MYTKKNDREKRREESRSQRNTVEKALQLEDFNAISQSEQSSQKRERLLKLKKKCNAYFSSE